MALLAHLEISDGLATRRPDDVVDDRGTIERFGAGMSIAIAGSCISIVVRRPLPRHVPAWWGGLALVWLGAGVNRAARRRLGPYYRSQVTVVHDHQVVTAGPYRWVRHPMYSGATLICVGLGITVSSPESALWALPVLALVRRIQVEESVLRDALGEAYIDFSTDRARLVPGLW